MSGLRSRVKRIQRATHSRITQHDWELVADSWKERLASANLRPEDFEEESARLAKEFNKYDPVKDDNAFRAAMTELVKQNINAYYAYMYTKALELGKKDDGDSWVRNSQTKFLEMLRALRKQHRDKMGG